MIMVRIFCRLDSTEQDNAPKFSARERLELYYTSPVIKFFLNTITYLIFLGEFTQHNHLPYFLG